MLLLLTDSMYEFTSGADHKVIVYRTDDELKAFVCFRTMAVKLIISHQYIHQIRDDVWDNVYPVSSIYWLQHLGEDFNTNDIIKAFVDGIAFYL